MMTSSTACSVRPWNIPMKQKAFVLHIKYGPFPLHGISSTQLYSLFIRPDLWIVPGSWYYFWCHLTARVHANLLWKCYSGKALPQET